MTTIRFASPRDGGGCAAIYAPYVRETAISFELVPPDAETVRGRILATLDSHPWLVCEHDGEVVGYAYAGPHRRRDAYQWSVDSSVYVADRYHRRGVARGLYASLFAVLRIQGHYNVYAGTTLPNPPSVAFHRSMGFRPVGRYRNVGYKAGEWHDVQWWHRLLQPLATDPDPPTPLADVTDEASLREAVRSGLERVSL